MCRRRRGRPEGPRRGQHLELRARAEPGQCGRLRFEHDGQAGALELLRNGAGEFGHRAYQVWAIRPIVFGRI